MLLDGKWGAPALHIIGSSFDDAGLVHRNLLLCVIYLWPLTFQLQPILYHHCQLTPKIKFLHRS